MRRSSVLTLLGALAACSPALDWREVRPAGDTLVALLPCKPERRVRELPLAGSPVAVEVLACTADGTTWGLTSADVGDASRVAPALAALREARARNLGGREAAVRPQPIKGLPQPGLRFAVQGVRPDGEAVVEESLLFAQGTRVFHAAALGGRPPAAALETFFDNLAPRR